MLRHSSTLGLGLGLLLVLPALASTQDAQSLEKALDETVRALAVLTGLEQDLPARPPEERLSLARSATEPSLGDAQQRDETLTQLRKDVGRLQMAHDELARLAPGTALPADADAARVADAAAPIASLSISTGMDDHLRAQLSSEPLLPYTRAATSSAPSAAAGDEPPKDANAADELRRGQALYRAEKYKEALVVLRRIEADPRATYWTARTLEKLNRPDEALELYKQVAADKSAGYLAERAKNDAEFLEWKKAFAKKLEKPEAKPAPSPTKTPPAPVKGGPR